MKTLKVLFTALLISLTFTSCQKEEVNVNQCNCGVVVDKMISGNSQESLAFLISVRNDCTSNIEWFNIHQISSYINTNSVNYNPEEGYDSININDNECVYLWQPDGSKSELYW